MFRFLHRFSKDENLYCLLLRIYPFAFIASLILFLVSFYMGLYIAPSDLIQKDAFRIIYIHVPAAIFSMGIYLSMAILGLIGLVWRLRQSLMMLRALATTGALFTLMALITGSIWGKPMWGAWWVWDARLTAELILLFLYLAIIALNQAFDDFQQGLKMAAILSLVGVVNLPIIHFSVEWWNTLHQGATITKFEAPSIAPEMFYPLLLSLCGFFFFFIASSCYRMSTMLLDWNMKRPWVLKYCK